MNYNFDEIINRKGTDSVKWDAVEGRWGRNDLPQHPILRNPYLYGLLFHQNYSSYCMMFFYIM